jgi:nicotinate-nucleotide pyrophosphorylase (carboxylating)
MKIMDYYNKIIIERKLREFLEEDCNFADVSASVIPKDIEITAKIFAKSKGYFSGEEEIKILFNILNVSTDVLRRDGEKVKNGDILISLKGKARDILLGERIGLNLLTHMCAITSTTKKFVNMVHDSGKKVRIACTRKTIPGMRIFEKRAVILGGGDSHRFSLDDMILLKDTHLKYYKGRVDTLLKETKERASFSKKIEIEIEKVQDVLIAAQNGADIIMLDNMTLDQVQEAINLLKNNNLRNKVLIEVSGGISEDNISEYLKAEPDIISIGQLTQFPSERVDLSLRFD